MFKATRGFCPKCRGNRFYLRAEGVEVVIGINGVIEDSAGIKSLALDSRHIDVMWDNFQLVEVYCEQCGEVIMKEGQMYDFIQMIENSLAPVDAPVLLLDSDEELKLLQDGEEVMIDGAFLRWNEKLQAFTYSHGTGDSSMFKDGEEIMYQGNGYYVAPKASEPPNTEGKDGA